VNIQDAIQILTRTSQQQSGRDWKIFVKVFQPGSVGGTPCVEVAGMQAGIDWDAGRIIVTTNKELTTLSPEDVAAIHKSAKSGQSWHAFQQYKKQADRIKVLEAELAALKLTKEV
jgi:hypothetical protein